MLQEEFLNAYYQLHFHFSEAKAVVVNSHACTSSDHDSLGNRGRGRESCSVHQNKRLSCVPSKSLERYINGNQNYSSRILQVLEDLEGISVEKEAARHYKSRDQWRGSFKTRGVETQRIRA